MKVLGLLLVMGVCAQASMEAGVAMQSGLRQLRQDGSDSCGAMQDNTDLPSGNTLNKGGQDITDSNEECCNLCDLNPDCKSWTRIKYRTRWNKRGECWLRDHVPAESTQCGHCISGVKKSVDEILDECEKKGTATGAFTSRGACSTLISKCPPPPVIAAKRLSDARSSKTPAYVDKLSEAVRARREKTCKKLFENSCIRGGFDKALEKGGDCARILNEGPHPDRPVAACPDFGAAINIMEKELAALCRDD